jgi:hypothetical protein
MKISTLLFLCAISLSTLAAYYSIVGLATIFSSAFWPVVFMASILEVSKLVVTSWLYHKWNIVTGWVKGYLVTAVIILMIITSLGIFGFLSRAHVDQNLNNTAVQLRIEQLNTQISAANEVVDRYRDQLEQLNRSINIQLENNRATQALAARQRQTTERDQIRQRLDSEQQKIADLTQQRLQLRQQISVLESEVGPIRYIAEFFVTSGQVDLEKAIRWMIVVLVLVFDPLAVLMLIAANISFSKERRQELEIRDDTSVPYQPMLPLTPSPIGPIVGEIVSIDGRPYRWWDGANWQPIEELPSKEPNLGDLVMVDGRPIRWWDGNAWAPIDVPVPLLPQYSPVEIARLIDESIGKWMSNRSEVTASVDADEIRNIVKASMDEWLTKASRETQSNRETNTVPTETIPNPLEPDVIEPELVKGEPSPDTVSIPQNGQPDRVQPPVSSVNTTPSWL